MDTEAPSGTPNSKTRYVVLVVVLVAAATGAFFAGRGTANADRVAQMVKTNAFIGKDADQVRALLPKVVFEGGTQDSHTLCKVPGLFGDTYFQLTFKDGKVIGASAMSGPKAKAPID